MNVASMSDVFRDRLLVIPDYQRGYAWGSRQWDDFLSDLEMLPEGRSHYAGTVVLHPQDHAPCVDIEGSEHRVLHVVDGQQRLATVVLLLDAIRRHLDDSRRPLAEGIRKRFVELEDEDGSRHLKLTLGSDDNPFWMASVLADQPSISPPEVRAHRLLLQARRHIEAWLEHRRERDPGSFQDWLRELHRRVTRRLKVSLYQVDSDMEVGVIFEVMNNRGKPLSELEKVKNYLLYVASKLDISETARLQVATRIGATWSRVLHHLSAADLVRSSDEDQLLRTHWFAVYDPAPRHWSGSRSIKERVELRRWYEDGIPVDHVQLRKALESYLDTLEAVTVAYCDAQRPAGALAFRSLRQGRTVEEIRRWSQRLRRIGIMSPFLPLLVAVRGRWPQAPEAYLEVLELCERFAFRVYRVAEKRSDAGASSLYALAYEVHHQRVEFAGLKARIAQIMLWYSKQKDFESYFSFDPDDSNWYQWSGLRYLLYEYETSLVGADKLKLDWDHVTGKHKLTIEHVLPQTPNHEYWRKRFDKKDRAQLTHYLGNLTLTHDNSVYSNKPFPQKRGSLGTSDPCYANSTLQMEKDIAAMDEWTRQAILNRGERIFAWAKQRWSVPVETAIPAPHEGESEDPDLERTADEVFVERPRGKRLTVRWVHLHQRFGDRITEDRPFSLRCGDRVLTATPDFSRGRGKNLVLGEALSEEALAQVPRALERGMTDWEAGLVRGVADLVSSGGSVPISNLTLFLQATFSTLANEPDWQTPSELWRHDELDRTIAQLDEQLRREWRAQGS